MKIRLNSERGCRAVALVCFLLAMVIIIGGLGIWIICRLCKKLDRINGGGNGGTNDPPTNGDISIYSLTIQKSANLCEWTNFAYVTGFVNPPCVNPAHLFLGTQAENVRDAVVKGRHNSTRL